MHATDRICVEDYRQTIYVRRGWVAMTILTAHAESVPHLNFTIRIAAWPSLWLSSTYNNMNNVFKISNIWWVQIPCRHVPLVLVLCMGWLVCVRIYFGIALYLIYYILYIAAAIPRFLFAVSIVIVCACLLPLLLNKQESDTAKECNLIGKPPKKNGNPQTDLLY